MSDTITFAWYDWERIVSRAVLLTNENNGHEYVHMLKTRCVHCGRSPRQRGRCPHWRTAFANRILFVLMNQSQELT